MFCSSGCQFDRIYKWNIKCFCVSPGSADRWCGLFGPPRGETLAIPKAKGQGDRSAGCGTQTSFPERGNKKWNNHMEFWLKKRPFAIKMIQSNSITLITLMFYVFVNPNEKVPGGGGHLDGEVPRRSSRRRAGAHLGTRLVTGMISDDLRTERFECLNYPLWFQMLNRIYIYIYDICNICVYIYNIIIYI